jgi:ABC-2 type transport system permease protein
VPEPTEAPAAEPVAIAAPAPEPELPAPVAPPARAARTAHDVLWDSGLLNVLALTRRDLAALFLWPASYAIAAAVVVLVATLGYLAPVPAGDPITMAGVFEGVAVATAFLTPLVTMRLLAEDRRSGTLELLLAAPVRCWELVAAWWLAGLLFLLATVAFTLPYVLLLAVSQPGIDVGAIAAGYVGVVLAVATWVALGLLAASLAPNRVTAAAAGIVALLALWYATAAAAGLVSPPWSDLLDYASAANRALSFERGQVVLRDAVYFLTLTAGALVLTARLLASRRGR